LSEEEKIGCFQTLLSIAKQIKTFKHCHNSVARFDMKEKPIELLNYFAPKVF